MYSPRESRLVLDDLGDKLPQALLRATDLTREDYADFRAKFPAWTPRFFERDIANLLHPRIWAHLEDELEGVPDVECISAEPVREVVKNTASGRSYVMRVKRHGRADRIRSYPTLADVRFWSGFQETFDGLERVNLALGYRWDAEKREIGEPVISYREGKDKPVWVVTIDATAAGSATPFTYTPIVPELPTIDFRETETDTNDETGTES